MSRRREPGRHRTRYELLWEAVRDRHGFGAFAQRAAPRLGRLASHRALGGPDRMFLQARLARLRGDTAAACARLAGHLGPEAGDPGGPSSVGL